MASSLFPQQTPQPSLLALLKSKNPQQLYNQLLQTNPQFSAFVSQNQGKTPEQIASDYGVDFGQVKTLLQSVR
jgi:hypothetical protein